MVSTRKHKYVITIDFAKKDNNEIYKGEVPYPFSKSYTDTVSVFGNKIIIVAQRSNKVEISGIFENYTSAIYTQIVKALVYYYCNLGEAIQISEISIDYIRNLEFKSSHKIENTHVNQIVSKADQLSNLKKLNHNAVNVIFEETVKGHSYLIALTHLVKSHCSESPYDAFERKWKAFNAIYRQVSGLENEFKRLSFIRKDLVDNPEYYPLIINEVSKLKTGTIRSKVRWIKFIYNNFSTIKQTDNYKNFILSNDDYRLAEINQSTLTVREDFLKEKGFYEDVTAHLVEIISKKRINNSHLAATLCIKYMYFVRNKSVHAEKIDSSFRLTALSKEENEIIWLSNLLDLLLIDLVNGHEHF
ncbi:MULTISPECIES: hypothetical protein [Pseudoalteromonas]|uniref:hypothetical protein n=1 Tax=Pseudoalteromonas TaxID=53246 RepID=UPI00119599E2|nr:MULTISPECIES: hypothetical protein [Pseudoalteromonas]TVU77226.1 hypothetical protein FQP81_03840 [Pseudoalteromonas elyakovii]